MKKIQFFLYLTFTIMIAACDNNSGGGDPMPELPKLSIGDVTRFEGNENLYYSFIVTASASFSKEIKVDYCTEEITAGEGTDFINTSGTITLPAGERNASIEVEIVADTLKEIDEQFKVILSNPVNAVLVDTEGLGTIRNDDTFIDIPEDGYITPDNHLGYHLVWQDEFNDAALNEADWTYEIWPPGQVNNELQTYTDREENLYFSDGNLVIEAKKESHAGAAYTSARIITQNKQFFQWGRVDIRAILPEGQGIWPALWMLGTNIEDVGWPACGEIDIMELVGHEPSTTHGTAHWGPQGQSYSIYRGQGYSLSDGKFSDEYHVFSIIWDQDIIKWYVDETEFFSITKASINEFYPFNASFFFIFNIAVGGNWPGSPDETTQFPQRMYVDYIRMFQRIQ